MKQLIQIEIDNAQGKKFGAFHCQWCALRWVLVSLISVCFFNVVAINSGAALEKKKASTLQSESQVSFSEKDISPQHIVSINLCTDELILRLVEPERVAALTRFSDNAEVSTVSENARGIKKTEPDIESILACGPDLLLGGRFSNREALHFFQYSNVPVLIFDVPKSFEDIYRDIRRLAAAVGEKENGEAIIKQMQDELDALKAQRRKEAGRGSDCPTCAERRAAPQAVFFQSDHYVPGEGTFENAVMEAAGLENIAVSLGIRGYGRIDLETLIGSRPDVIIFSGEQKDARTVRGEVLNHPAIKKALPDVKTVTIPAKYLNCGSPASVKAVKLLVSQIQDPS